MGNSQQQPLNTYRDIILVMAKNPEIMAGSQ